MSEYSHFWNFRHFNDNTQVLIFTSFSKISWNFEISDIFQKFLILHFFDDFQVCKSDVWKCVKIQTSINFIHFSVISETYGYWNIWNLLFYPNIPQVRILTRFSDILQMSEVSIFFPAFSTILKFHQIFSFFGHVNQTSEKNLKIQSSKIWMCGVWGSITADWVS